jgi:hypothetical protein
MDVIGGLIGGMLLVVLTTVIVGVLVPVTLVSILVRQIRRSRRPARIHPRRTTPLPATPALGRRWAMLTRDAVAAGERYRSVIARVRPGPLRESLDAAADEVAAAVSEVRRLAVQGDGVERAHRDVVTALERQRRQRRRAPQMVAGLEQSLDAAAQAQADSAGRLAAAAARDHAQLQLIVARLHELTAHALELQTMAIAPALQGSVFVAERLAALRAATAELDQVVTA